MKPREYQAWGVAALWDWFRNNQEGHPVIKMPTGTGKSIIIADAIQQAFGWQPTARVMMLTTSKQLIKQNYEKMLKVWPKAPIGIYSAGLSSRDIYEPIIFAGIQSVADKANLFGHVDLVFIDECDRVPDDMKSQYRKFITGLIKFNPHVRFIGLTATDWRTGSGKITESDKCLFTDVAVDMCTVESYNWFVEMGYLARLTSKRTTVKLDTDGVSVTGGEYNLAQLERAVNKADITIAALHEAMECGAMERRKWLVFCSGIDHCIDTAAIMNSMGIEARVCHSKSKDNDAAIEWFANYQGTAPAALINNDMLTVGFDDSGIDLLFILRPTKSSRLWVQILGRGTRPLFADGFDLDTQEGRLMAIAASDKQDTMVLDFAHNVLSMGPINDPLIPSKKKKGSGVAPVKECPQCNEQVHASVKICPGIMPVSGEKCGYVFPENIKIQTNASEQEFIKKEEPAVIDIFKVDSVNYSIHTKAGTENMLHVRYYCGVRSFDDYVCIAHPEGTPARRRAQRWWSDRARDAKIPTPPDAQTALAWAAQLKTPTHLSVHVNVKYPRITDYCYDGTQFNRIKITDPYQLVKPTVYVGNSKKNTRLETKQTFSTFDEDLEAHNVD